MVCRSHRSFAQRPNVAGRTDFLHWIKQQRITVLDLPTAYWHELVHELAESHEKLPERLRLVIVGGEKASASAYASWLKAGGKHVRWVNTYGPTEASVIVSAYEPDPSQPFPENLPIGRPIANVRLYVLDSELQPVGLASPANCILAARGCSRIFEPSRTHGSKVYCGSF